MESAVMTFIVLVIFSLYARGTIGDFRSSLFKTKQGIKLSSNSNWFPVCSKSYCVHLCLSVESCCVASYIPDERKCTLEISNDCCPVTEYDDAAISIYRNSCLAVSNHGQRIVNGLSRYAIVQKSVTWQDGVRICESDGGKLCEIETEEENKFLKDQLSSPGYNGVGYFIGAYKFNKDSTFEWISRPNDTLPFTDLQKGEPSHPESEFCLAMYRSTSYKWVDISCEVTLTFICEYHI